MADERRADDGRRTTPPPDALQELLADMRELRLTFATDLTSAAGAADAGADSVVGDILIGEQRELAAFARRSRARLASLAAALPDTPAPVPAPAARVRTWRRRALVAIPAVPLVGALGVTAAAATGLLPLPGHHSTRAVTNAYGQAAGNAPVASTFHEFETVVRSDPSASEVVAAATMLHSQLAQLIADAPEDPAGATEVARLLQMEQALLIRTQPPGTATVLAASRKLAARLVVVVATSEPSTPPSAGEMQPSHQHRSPGARSTATATPTSATTPSATPSTAPAPASTTAPSASSSPTPSPSSSDGFGQLPTIGN